MSNFWEKLNKPFFCLAPMEEVTDTAFREMFARYSSPDSRFKTQNSKGNPFVMFTEFVNVDGLTHPEGRKKLAIDLQYTEEQRPIVAQIWGTNPEKFYEAAQIVADLGFDGIDINMGCPQSKEIKIGACAALMREPKLAQEIIASTKKGAGNLPVSVKTRIGYSRPEEMEDWVKNLLEMDIAALTIHGRTKQEMSKVPANWDKIAEAVAIRDKVQGSRFKGEKTLIIGNGDVKTREDGLEKAGQTGVDGIMVGRGAFGDPWFFAPQKNNIKRGTLRSFSEGGRKDGYQPSQKERLSVMLEHAELFEKTFSGIKSFYLMRKHFKAYCSGFLGAGELRAKLMGVKNFEETKIIVEEYLKTAQE